MEYKIHKTALGYVIFRYRTDGKFYSKSEYWTGEERVNSIKNSRTFFTENDALSALVIAKTKGANKQSYGSE